ncbi:tocopherol cyclase family protein [Dethiobacter alkaliphilus]|uniref:tocopherol cyclase family protein n=1 Tax=Dethiobacter alkaliphilus TaxID=427926 RepID=UPI0022263B80|nr:tocopherol cyclase family protein [Dethiobacter alkaliphilus]MCW3491004.1 tocopherol cyclase family protein [Dethiobacter alkaliphilus]
MLRSIFNPDLYHGHNRHSNFFEGWYFKIIDPSEEYRFAFIPGIFKGKTPDTTHSFLQIVDGSAIKYHYLRYDGSAFSAKPGRFDISVAGNRFSLEQLSLSIDHEEKNISGTLTLNEQVKWPDSVFSPGSMGYYNFLTFMQCYSQVCCLDATLSGTLEINGQSVDFTGGSAYIEKNWGRDFPYGWIWVQANNFSRTGTSLSCSIGHIPFLFTSFRGFLIGFLANGVFYKFTTMNKSKVDIVREGEHYLITAWNKKHLLQIRSLAPKGSFVLCNAPRQNNMQPFVEESLQGRVEVLLMDYKTNHIIFHGSSSSAGIEYGGRQELVLIREKNLKPVPIMGKACTNPMLYKADNN